MMAAFCWAALGRGEEDRAGEIKEAPGLVTNNPTGGAQVPLQSEKQKGKGNRLAKEQKSPTAQLLLCPATPELVL